MITHPILRKYLYQEEREEEVITDKYEKEEMNEIKEGSEEADDEGQKERKIWRKKQIKKKRSSPSYHAIRER